LVPEDAPQPALCILRCAPKFSSCASKIFSQ